MHTRTNESEASPRARAHDRTRRAGGKPVTDPARRTAYDVLAGVRTRDAYANLLLAAALSGARLHGKDAALATELVYGTLRHQGSYDAIIGICADRGLGQIDPAVLDVLRIGVHQLLGMRVKPHAAVATSVDIAIEVAGRRSAGFVNAVLRRIAPRDLDGWIAIAAPGRAADLIGHLAVRYSHPRWIISALAEALGEKPAVGLGETEAALAADADRPVVHLAAIPGLADIAELIAAGATVAQWSPFGAYCGYGDPGAIDAVAQRRAGVQDEASQLAALALTRPAMTGDASSAGEGWLDLCAGPGGKAKLLAALAERHDAKLIAADLHMHRAALAREALGRLGAAQVVVADGLAPAWRSGSFYRVLADVPCSGLGSLRRRPEVRWRRSPDDIEALGDVQRRLLACAIDATVPGGIVGYVTCSPHVAETRQVLADVLRTRPVEVIDAPAVLSDVPKLRCPEPYGRYAQFWPHRHGTDAIFIALLRVRR
jgi:16S rRNA (cytosine967-C5)-methyltransferase